MAPRAWSTRQFSAYINPSFDAQSAAQVCQPNQAYPSERAFTPRHTPSREYDCQRVASCHLGPHPRWGCAECHRQHGPHRHVSVGGMKDQRGFSVITYHHDWVMPQPYQKATQGPLLDPSFMRRRVIRSDLVSVFPAPTRSPDLPVSPALRKSFPNQSALDMDFTSGQRWFPSCASSFGLLCVYPSELCVGYASLSMDLQGIIAWPIAKVLELTLGAHHGIIYRRAGMYNLSALLFVF